MSDKCELISDIAVASYIVEILRLIIISVSSLIARHYWPQRLALLLAVNGLQNSRWIEFVIWTWLLKKYLDCIGIGSSHSSLLEQNVTCGHFLHRQGKVEEMIYRQDELLI